jgi:hypothetical protein
MLSSAVRRLTAAVGREENSESPPDRSHPASQVTTAHVDG